MAASFLKLQFLYLFVHIFNLYKQHKDFDVHKEKSIAVFVKPSSSELDTNSLSTLFLLNTASMEVKFFALLILAGCCFLWL